VIVHHTGIGGNVRVSGGGGGVSCGFAHYGDFEDDIIGGDLTITGWQSCWLGMFRVTVMHNVYFNSNTVADPDGNEIGNDTILGDLHFSGNSPSTHTGASAGGPSVCRRQCERPVQQPRARGTLSATFIRAANIIFKIRRRGCPS
jgi:hypothetical protein